MKLLLLSLFIAVGAHASECVKIADSLDREYCFKKQLRKDNNARNSFIQKHKSGISAQAKANQINLTKSQIELKKNHIEFLQKELEALKKHEQTVAKLTTIQPKVKKKKKKKKKSRNLLKGLGIRL